MDYKDIARSITAGFKTTVKLASIASKLPKDERVLLLGMGGDPNVKRVFTETLNIEKGKGAEAEYTIYLSTRDLDSDNDVVTPTDWDLSYYTPRPRGLWSHKHGDDPIYKAVWTKADDYGLKQGIVFAPTERGQNYRMLVEGGYLNTFSAGFRIHEGGTVMRGEQDFQKMVDAFRRNWPEFSDKHAKDIQRVILQKLLIESSLVNLPSNPFAMVQAVEEGKLSLCEQVRKELHVEAYIQKAAKGELKDGPPVTKPNDPMTPPKAWMDRCMARMESEPDVEDPGAVCATIWRNRKELEIEGETKTSSSPIPVITAKGVSYTRIVYPPTVTIREVPAPQLTDKQVGAIVEKKIHFSIAKARGAV